MTIPHYIKDDFIAAFNALQEIAHVNSFSKGFWETDNVDTDGNKIALMHEELSEALSALRHGNPPDDKIPEFTGAEAELADCIVRIMDLAGKRGFRVAEALVAKMDFNASRPYKHGKKF